MSTDCIVTMMYSRLDIYVQFIIELLSPNVLRLVIMHVDCYSVLKMSQQILVKEICFSLFIFLIENGNKNYIYLSSQDTNSNTSSETI